MAERSQQRRTTILGVAGDDVTEDEAIAYRRFHRHRRPAPGDDEQPGVCDRGSPQPVLSRSARSGRSGDAGRVWVATRDEEARYTVPRPGHRGRSRRAHRVRSGGTGRSLYLLGAAHPGLRVVGCSAGSPHAADDPAICARIAEARPDVLLVAYGHPAQNLWIARNQPYLRVPVAIGVGGAVDYLADAVPRASPGCAGWGWNGSSA